MLYTGREVRFGKSFARGTKTEGTALQSYKVSAESTLEYLQENTFSPLISRL